MPGPLLASVTSLPPYAFGYYTQEVQEYDEETKTYNTKYIDAKNEDLTIYCYEDSAAHKYAIENEFDYVLIGQAGDVNADGKTTMKDYSELQKYLSGWDVEIDTKAADLNGDGKVTMKDYAALQRRLNGWENV